MDMLEKILDKLANAAVNLGDRILLALVILFIGAKFIKFILKLVKKGFERTDIEISVEQFLYSLIRVALYVILAFLVASNCGVDAASIVALLGSAGVAIGLALQGSLSNVAGGVLILLMRPFRVGDYMLMRPAMKVRWMRFRLFIRSFVQLTIRLLFCQMVIWQITALLMLQHLKQDAVT